MPITDHPPPVCTCMHAEWPPWNSAPSPSCLVHSAAQWFAKPKEPDPAVATMDVRSEHITALADRLEESAKRFRDQATGHIAAEEPRLAGVATAIAEREEQWAADLRVAIRDAFGPGVSC